MLMPKKVKYRKQQRGRRRGKAWRGSDVSFGDYGLKATEACWLTDRQIEAARTGKPHPNFVRGGLKDGFVKSSPYGAMVSEGARKNAEAVRAKMMAGTFDIFGGELKDNTGKVVIPKGKIFKQTDAELEGTTHDQVVRRLLEQVKVPR